MTNISSSGFSNQELDLARVYGLDDTMNNTRQDLDNLTGYNFNQSQPTTITDNEIVRQQSTDNAMNARSNENMTSNESNTCRNENMANNAMNTRSNENMTNNAMNTRSNENMTNNAMNTRSNENMTNNAMNTRSNENMTNNAMNTRSNENMTNNMMTDSSMSMQQRMTDNEQDVSRADGQRIQQLMPQRQEQTLPPETREPFGGNMQFSGQVNQIQSMGNMNSFLRNQIGQNVSVQFLVGTNTLIEKSGVLLGLGNNYIVLRENGSGDILVCDFNDVKFIRFEGDNRQIQM